MIGVVNSTLFSIKNQKVILYYLLYVFIFLLGQIALTSIFTFFHFLLEHDMNSIESWLSRNSWETLCLSKLIALVAVTKILKLNIYDDLSIVKLFSTVIKRPSKKIWGVCVFILFFIYILIEQFSAGTQPNQLQQDLIYTSYLGSICFYLFDILLIITVQNYYHASLSKLRILIVLTGMFVLSSKVALPYMERYIYFIFLHIFFLLHFVKRHEFGDILTYLFLVVGPLSAIFGVDIVWDNQYSVFSFNESLPMIGIFGIWGVALGYYQFSRSH